MGSRAFPGTRIITCMAVDKCRHCLTEDILIDDTLKYRHLWEEAGGIFIHHRRAKASLAELRTLLPSITIADSLGRLQADARYTPSRG